MVDKMLYESQTNLDKQFHQVLNDRIREFTALSSSETEQKIRAAMNRANALAVQDVQERIKQQFESFETQVLVKAKDLDQKTNKLFADSVGNQLNIFIEETKENLSQLDIKIKQSYAAAIQDVDAMINEKVEERLVSHGRLGVGFEGPDRILREVNQVVEGVKLELKSAHDRLNEYSGMHKGFEGEMDNLISIKISNETSNMSKNLNEKLRQINEQYIAQTKDSMDGLLERIKNSEQVAGKLILLEEKQGHMEETIKD